MITVTGNVAPFIEKQRGRLKYFTSGTVRFMLVMPPRTSHVAKHKTTGYVAQVHIDVPVDFTGNFKAQLERNDEISPAGTSYSVMILIPNISLVPMHYEFNGTGPFNLNAMPSMAAHEAKNRQAQELREKIADLQRQLKDIEG